MKVIVLGAVLIQSLLTSVVTAPKSVPTLTFDEKFTSAINHANSILEKYADSSCEDLPKNSDALAKEWDIISDYTQKIPDAQPDISLQTKEVELALGFQRLTEIVIGKTEPPCRDKHPTTPTPALPEPKKDKS